MVGVHQPDHVVGEHVLGHDVGWQLFMTTTTTAAGEVVEIVP